ncbi:MAG: molybdopterin-dependent oxidoreductase [Pirellulales bacterium]|nr:molybdopterin-dependent oxidoreductase [Pirellulales bacterium]
MASLAITGEVEQACELSVDDLTRFADPFQIADVSKLDSDRQGQGVWLEGILQAVKPEPAVKYLTLHASADDFHASIPLKEIQDRSFLIFQRDGVALPVDAGGPFRFCIVDSAACQTAEVDDCANVKFVDRMEFSTEPGQDSRPVTAREHAALHAKEERHRQAE